jgi:hypothetical protein
VTSSSLNTSKKDGLMSSVTRGPDTLRSAFVGWIKRLKWVITNKREYNHKEPKDKRGNSNIP